MLNIYILVLSIQLFGYSGMILNRKQNLVQYSMYLLHVIMWYNTQFFKNEMIESKFSHVKTLIFKKYNEHK